MSLNYRAIGRRIMIIRKRNNISQLVFSELIDKSPTYVSYIENGKKSMSLDTFVQIANALDIPADILLAEQLTGSVMAASQEITMQNFPRRSCCSMAPKLIRQGPEWTEGFTKDRSLSRTSS